MGSTIALLPQEPAAFLEEAIAKLDSRHCKVVEVSTARLVRWICVLPSFLQELKPGLQAERSNTWYMCADFAHALEIMGFKYG